MRDPARRFDVRIVRPFERAGNVVHARRSFTFDHRRFEWQPKELARRVLKAPATGKKIGEVVTTNRSEVKRTRVFCLHRGLSGSRLRRLALFYTRLRTSRPPVVPRQLCGALLWLSF